MQAPSYDEVINPKNAHLFPVLSHVLVAHFSAAAPRQPQSGSRRATWEFQSLDGAFKAFSTEISYMLEAAQSRGLLTFDIPERHWFINLREMTQTNSQVMKRCFCFATLHGFCS